MVGSMHSKLTHFLIENNYAEDVHSAQRILECSSKDFYNYVAESSAEQSRLRRQIQDIEQRNPNDPRLSQLRQRHSELATQTRVAATENVPNLRQKRKEELQQKRQTAYEKEVQNAGERALADIQGREPPRISSTINRGPSTWVGGGASKPRDTNTATGTLSNVVKRDRNVVADVKGRAVKPGTPGSTRVTVTGSPSDQITSGIHGDLRDSRRNINKSIDRSKLPKG